MTQNGKEINKVINKVINKAINNDALKQELKELIIKELKLMDVVPDQIDDDSPLFGENSDLDLDSLDAVELVVMLQKNYNIEIGDRETAIAAFASINVMAEYVAKSRSDS